MTADKRQWSRAGVAVPCLIGAVEDARDPSRGVIVNLSQGGVMVTSEEGFAPNQRVTIILDQEYDALLFEFADTLTGIVRWSQTIPSDIGFPYQLGVAFEHGLPHRLHLVEQ